MSVKRLLAILLIACIFAAMGGCAPDQAEPKETSVVPTQSAGIGGETTVMNMTYLSEKLVPPEGFEQALNNAVISGSLVFMTDGEKLWCMGREGIDVQEVVHTRRWRGIRSERSERRTAGACL